MDINNYDLHRPLNDDEVIDTAYDIFLELAPDNLDTADVILFNLQFEDRGAAELYNPDPVIWAEHASEVELADDDMMAEVVIGLTNDDDVLDDVFARVLLSRDRANKSCFIIWKE